MIDIGIITGSGICELSGGQGQESRVVQSRFGDTEVAIFRVGSWTVGGISRHGKRHHHLPHTVPHRANLMALEQLGARAVLATTVVGAVDPGIRLGQPILFDDLYFPENRLPSGEACTIFTEPGDVRRGHFIGSPFSPSLRRKMELSARGLGIEVLVGGVYAHTNGPRFESRAEIKALDAVGVAAVSQTCGPRRFWPESWSFLTVSSASRSITLPGLRSSKARRNSTDCSRSRPKFCPGLPFGR